MSIAQLFSTGQGLGGGSVEDSKTFLEAREVLEIDDGVFRASIGQRDSMVNILVIDGMEHRVNEIVYQEGEEPESVFFKCQVRKEEPELELNFEELEPESEPEEVEE